jgi:hypothetical protein
MWARFKGQPVVLLIADDYVRVVTPEGHLLPLTSRRRMWMSHPRSRRRRSSSPDTQKT